MESAGVTARVVVDARKETFAKRETIAILRRTGRVVAMKGKKVVDYDLKRDPPPEKELLEAILGPTGNLRAPAIRMGKTLVVGFQEDTWKSIIR
jgi:arsenate reductase-like glutaredoxin family protein